MDVFESSKNGQELENILAHGSEEEQSDLKAWLFKENIRLETMKRDLEQTQKKFIEEKTQFQEEMKELNRTMVIERKRLKEDNLFFDKKMEILKSGFSQLDMDRRKFEKEKRQFEEDKTYRVSGYHSEIYTESAELLFRGVHNPLSLKKRYKDLLKMFHPDNIAGDHDMVLYINKVYDKLKKEYDIGRNA